jgi:hypothetical protein
MPNERFRADPALAPLKTFQRRTVDYVFDRLYGQDDPVRQFLVADEVGLGKTMVARGVIARMIEHLWDSSKRIDILYICSNQAIAAQNLNRLNVLGRRELALPTRMTLVPLQLRDQTGLDANKVNFISLTPGTTFDLRSATGVIQERALLFHLLRDLVARPRGLHNLLQVTAGVEGWNRAVDNLTLEGIDRRIIERFRRDVQADRDLFEELERVCELFPRRREIYSAPSCPMPAWMHCNPTSSSWMSSSGSGICCMATATRRSSRANFSTTQEVTDTPPALCFSPPHPTGCSRSPATSPTKATTIRTSLRP